MNRLYMETQKLQPQIPVQQILAPPVENPIIVPPQAPAGQPQSQVPIGQPQSQVPIGEPPVPIGQPPVPLGQAPAPDQVEQQAQQRCISNDGR